MSAKSYALIWKQNLRQNFTNYDFHKLLWLFPRSSNISLIKYSFLQKVWIRCCMMPCACCNILKWMWRLLHKVENDASKGQEGGPTNHNTIWQDIVNKTNTPWSKTVLNTSNKDSLKCHQVYIFDTHINMYQEYHIKSQIHDPSTKYTIQNTKYTIQMRWDSLCTEGQKWINHFHFWD